MEKVAPWNTFYFLSALLEENLGNTPPSTMNTGSSEMSFERRGKAVNEVEQILALVAWLNLTLTASHTNTLSWPARADLLAMQFEVGFLCWGRGFTFCFPGQGFKGQDHTIRQWTPTEENDPNQTKSNGNNKKEILCCLESQLTPSEKYKL